MRHDDAPVGGAGESDVERTAVTQVDDEIGDVHDAVAYADSSRRVMP